jgi:small-conductance mechanosensitive channel/CRP-like cAMP-binding protein
MGGYNMNKKTLKHLGIPLFFLLLFLIPGMILDPSFFAVSSELLRRTIWIGRYVAGTCLWLTLAWFVIRFIDFVIWPFFVEQRLGYTIPRLLKDLVRLIVVVTAVGVIISVVFEKSITGFLAASGVLGLVLGFALRNMIADFFSGIALNLERSFAVGDRVQIEGNDLTGDIVEINWRTTVIKNFTGNYWIIPNSRMAAMQVENFHKPERSHYNWHFLTLDFDVPVERAERIILAAMKQAQTPFGVTTPPIARVRLPNERGMEYVMVYEVPEYRFRGRMRAAMMRSIMQHFAVAGIRPVYPKHNIYTADMPLRQPVQQPNPHDVLKHVELFTVLNDAELALLATHMTPHMFTAANVIVEQGESGASMYIVAEGLLYVYLERVETAALIKVAELSPGQFFGEISLLTGAPRSATVKAETDALVYEITKEDMELLLDKRPEIAERLTEIIAKRRVQSEEFMKHLPAEQQAVEAKNLAAQLMDKVRGFFNVFRRAVVSKDQISNFSEVGREE